MNKVTTVAIVTLVPKERIPPGELDQHDFSLPPNHRITCTLLDARRRSVIASHTDAINALPPTSLISLRHAPFVKEVMVVPTSALPAHADLLLDLKYETGGRPLDRDMFVLVMNEPPLL